VDPTDRLSMLQRMSSSHADRSTRFTRLALWVSLAISALLLIASLLVAKPAQALSVGALPNIPLGESEPGEASEDAEEEDWEDMEEGEWEDEETEEEQEEREEKESRKHQADPPLPAQCLLRTADAKAVVYTAQDKGSLTIRYISLSPIDVTVDYRLRGGKGSLSLGGTKEHFAKQGVLHRTERLSKGQAAKARAAHDVTVQLRFSDAPHCGSAYTERLSIRQALSNQVAWMGSNSAFRSARHPR
jgi:hypothetical protein